eukprot:TRINITY_DN1154_c0_g2_i1.p1 TRINITY_DN1154_c0_g2~~TRINITY_DN1154_c0_g2_i1.p1  ORF type:complete len:486 (+),score=181.61 TRINITY_DN1154_c0_g2_i1:71-1528(+)
MSIVNNVGLIGLGPMGWNLVQNVASRDIKIGVFNSFRNPKSPKTTELATLSPNITGYDDINEFIGSLETPRRLILLLPAGKPVEDAIGRLKPILSAGDMIIDGGNEWYENTIRRAESLKESGISWIGMGVSGGQDGARYGPSLMPGGNKESWQFIKPMMEAIAADVEGDKCVSFFEGDGAGNYVKMVHNGIEYGDMQLIAEAYIILKQLGGFSNMELAAIFEKWNKGELKSFLIEITAKIFASKDPLREGESLVDSILDATGMKGTGQWTVLEAVRKCVPTPTITAALDARYLSGLKDERVAATMLRTNTPLTEMDKKKLVGDVEKALLAAKITSYAQGLRLIREASEVNKWNIDISECARIWRGGCIIQAKLLVDITEAFKRNPDLKNLMFDDHFSSVLKAGEGSWRCIVGSAMTSGIPIPAMAASLTYFDMYRTERLAANLTQAQRDFFGAHTFKRTDREGTFTEKWGPLLEAIPAEVSAQFE